jgi:ribosomal-protein-alanine N-acetyltransferase
MTRIHTPRLVIRTLQVSDAEAWIAMINDPAVSRFLPPWPGATPEDFPAILESRRAMETEIGFSLWAVEERGTGTLVGQCGIRPVVEGAGQEIELAYHYHPASWGNGYATESAIAVLTYAFGTIRLASVIALVMRDNIASWRVTEKAGMRYVGSADYFGLRDLKKYVAARSWWRPPDGFPCSGGGAAPGP